MQNNKWFNDEHMAGLLGLMDYDDWYKCIDNTTNDNWLAAANDYLKLQEADIQVTAVRETKRKGHNEWQYVYSDGQGPVTIVSATDSKQSAAGTGWSGSLTDYVLERDGVKIKGEGITYIEFEYIGETFDEWKEYAEQGQEGFTIL